MFDYAPKLPELIFYPLVAVEVAHGIALALPTEYQAFCVAAVAVNCALLPVFYVWKESCKYVDGMSAGDTPKLQQAEERPTRADPELIPRVMAGGMLVHNLINETVSINAVKAFNQDLVTQHIGGLPVKMTENYWTKDKPDGERTRWVRIGGTGPTDWKDMMARGLAWGAYGTEGGQDKRVIKSIRKVSQLAQGYPLPTWSQLKKM